jgi:hypothetical protein
MPKGSKFKSQKGEAVKHELKCWPSVFEHVWSGDKTFEFRRNDRGFAKGDQILLREWDEGTEMYTGRQVLADVGYVLNSPSFSMPVGFCAFALLNCFNAVVGDQ